MSAQETSKKKRGDVRDIVRIGQEWRHRRLQFPIRIKQIHRADRTVEAWFECSECSECPEGPHSRQLHFADLRREYDLIDQSSDQIGRRARPPRGGLDE